MKTLKRKDLTKAKDLIMSLSPFIRYREKLVYNKEIKTSAGTQYHEFIDKDIKKIYFVTMDITEVFMLYRGRIVPVNYLNDLMDKISKK